MPLYEYHCRDCDAVFEEMATFARADEMECAACGSANTERLASSFSASMTDSGGSSAPPCGAGG